MNRSGYGIKLLLTAVPSFFFFSVAVWGQASHSTIQSIAGTVTQIGADARSFILKTDAGKEVSVRLQPQTLVRRRSETDSSKTWVEINNASKIELAGVSVGDLVLTSGLGSNQSLAATVVIITGKKRSPEDAARLEATFRDGVIKAWRAAGEQEPFASIRSDFDLTSADNRQWKTSVQLPDADRCVLIKTPGSATATPFWTFACQFRAAAAKYEPIVKSVQSALNITYQPDEASANRNQVFFSDSSKPGWRLVVTKIDPSLVALWITPQQLAAVMPFSEATQSSDVTIHDAIEKIRNGKYSPMPQAQRFPSAASAALGGRTTMTVRNSTEYELSVYFDGPVSRSLSLAPGASQTVDLAAGAFHVAGRATASNVLPFYGDDTYEGSSQYTLTFYVGR